MISPVPSRREREKVAMKAGVMQTLMDLWTENPANFEVLVDAIERRPQYGSLTVIFRRGVISQVDLKEILELTK